MEETVTICVGCPNGCRMQAAHEGGHLICLTGNRCAKGEAYALQELTDPVRTLCTNVLVEGGTMPLASVRLTAPIPRRLLKQAQEEIVRIHVRAPVQQGDILARHLLGQDADLIVTRSVPKASGALKK